MMEGTDAGNPVLDSFLPMLAAHGGVLLVAGVLPVVAYLLLDGLVALLRGRGVAPLLIAAGMVIAVGGIGVAMWQMGLTQLEGDPSYEVTRSGAEGNAKMFVSWAFVLGAIAFVARMVNQISPRRPRR